MATPTDRQLLIRLASTLPVGSEARRVVLAGCEKLKVPEMREQCEKSKKDGPPAAGKGKSKSKGDDKMPAELLEKFKAKKKAALPKGVQQLLAQLQANPDSTLPLKEATWLGPRRWDHANVLGNLGLVEWAPGGRGLGLTPKGKRYRLASQRSMWDSNRPALIRLASSLSTGSDERRVILARIQKEARGGWDETISGDLMRARFGDQAVMIEEMPGKPVKRKVRRIRFSTEWVMRGQWFNPGGPFLMGNIWNDAGITKNMTYDRAVAAMRGAIEEAGSNALKEAAKLSKKYPGNYMTPAEMQAQMDKVKWPKNFLGSEDVVSFLEVEPQDYSPISFRGKDFAGTSRWDEFTFYDEADKDDYMAQNEGMRAFYKSTSKGAARKLFKLLKADPSVVRNMDNGDFLLWLDKNKVSHRYVPTVWR